MTVRGTIEALVEAWNASDALRAAAFFAPDGCYAEAERPHIAGRDALVEHFAEFFRAGPEWRFEVDAILTSANQGAVRYRFATKGAAGAWCERNGCAWVRIEGGLIAEWREYNG